MMWGARAARADWGVGSRTLEWTWRPTVVAGARLPLGPAERAWEPNRRRAPAPWPWGRAGPARVRADALRHPWVLARSQQQGRPAFGPAWPTCMRPWPS